MQLIISTNPPSCRIDYRLPISEIKQEVGYFEFRYHGPKIEIEQQDALNEIGLGNLDYLVKSDYTNAKHIVLESIAKTARDGDRFAAEMISQDTAAQLAKEISYQEIPEINVDILPKTKPKVTMDYDLDIHWVEGQTQIDFHTYPPKIDWVKGSIDITVKKGSKIDIKG